VMRDVGRRVIFLGSRNSPGLYSLVWNWNKRKEPQMNTESYIEQLCIRMRLKSTEELIEIWIENNRKEWAKEAFEAIRQVLLERGENLPEQKEFSHQKPRSKFRLDDLLVEYRTMSKPKLVIQIGLKIFIVIICVFLLLIIYLLLFPPPRVPEEQSIKSFNQVRDELSPAKIRWETLGITNYNIDVEGYRLSCPVGSADHPVTLYVRNSKLISVTLPDETGKIKSVSIDNSPYSLSCTYEDFTIEEIFNSLEYMIKKIDPKEYYLNVTFDAKYGFVTKREISNTSQVVSECCSIYEFSNFRPFQENQKIYSK
jgi:hypothetical protein